mmetsp:Transcript_28791/g.81217  ORF Transcript_28791/g.81217 Transcript_28791/m.81217 type:complete len:169 (-) Transcript_28791:183-689(-)
MFCWTYANAWCELQRNNPQNSVAGPIFISIGDVEKLEAFLEKNPKIPRESVLVDDYEFGAYQAAGFSRFDKQNSQTMMAASKRISLPPFEGWKDWWTYLTTAGKIMPIPKDATFGYYPVGIVQLGGTFVINGNDIVYRWSEKLPSDHPEIEEVWSIAKEESEKTAPLP